jgi:pimeloyl-ACP methyl ester carboxylesterase
VLAEAWASFGQPSADLRALAPLVRCPTLFAWAKHDRVIPWERCKAAASKFPDHGVELFDAGHAAFLEDPDAFAAAFAKFCFENIPRGMLITLVPSALRSGCHQRCC